MRRKLTEMKKKNRMKDLTRGILKEKNIGENEYNAKKDEWIWLIFPAIISKFY